MLLELIRIGSVKSVVKIGSGLVQIRFHSNNSRAKKEGKAESERRKVEGGRQNRKNWEKLRADG